jgi:elongation factor P
MYNTSDIRKNLKIEIDGVPYTVVTYQFVKPGKGNAFTRCRLKNMITGAVLDRTYKTGEKLEPANLEELDMQFLYTDGDTYHFMNNQSYDQVEIDTDHVGDAVNYLVENMGVSILYFNGKPIGINLPITVDLKVVETEPGVKGDTATGATKAATLQTGYTVQVPLFIKEGEKIVIDTRTGDYLERAKG